MSKRRVRQFPDSRIGDHTPAQSRAAVRDAVRRALLVMAPSAMAVLGAGSAVANPEGGVVVRGNAVISGGPGVLNVNQSSHRAVINWRSFSIGGNETVNFHQPSSTSSTLNRVTSGQRSIIEGVLNANGRVFLINSSGVLFSNTAQVNVGSLVATTANVADDDFMAERLEFRGAGAAGAAIENFGSISIRDGGLAALVAPTVRNAGLIQANLGTVALGAGEAFTLDLYGDRLINFAVGGGPAGTTEAPGVSNAGTLIADGGQVLLTAQAASDVVGTVINMSGVVQARSVARDASGRILLEAGSGDVSVSGLLDARGVDENSTGGAIEVMGAGVDVSGSAVVDASGSAAGGTISIGGPPAAVASDRRADRVDIAAGAVIDASAFDTGDGGTVSVWGTEAATFAGSVFNRGGASGGDGGFVEVSSRGLLRFLGDADTSAQHGSAGVVLLDPAEITVGPTGSSSTTASLIDADALTRMLRNGTPVILAADNRITVNNIIDGRPLDGGTTGSGRVEMTAGTIVINAPVITNNAPIDLTATSGDITITGQGRLYVANGVGEVGSAAISLDADGSISSSGQIISLGTITLHARLNVALASALAGLNPGSGPTGVGELIVIADEGVASLVGATTTGVVNVTAADGISVTHGSIIAGGNVVFHGGSGQIDLASMVNNEGVAVSGIDSGGTVTLATTGAVTLNSGIKAAGDVTIGLAGDAEAGSEPVLIASLAMGEGATVQAGSNADSARRISVYARGNVTARNLMVGESGEVFIDAADGTADTVTIHEGLGGLSDSDGIGRLEILSDGQVSLRGARVVNDVELTGDGISNSHESITAGGDVTLMAGAGAVVLDGGGAAAIDSGGAVTVLTTGAVTVNDTILTSGGTITLGIDPDTEPDEQIASLTTAGDAVLASCTEDVGPCDAGGAVSIYAVGAVSLNGVLTGGTVNVAGSSIANASSTILARGDVTLSAGAEGIELEPILAEDGLLAGIDSGGTVRLATTGTLTLGSGIRTTAGDIVIADPEMRASGVSGEGSSLYSGRGIQIFAGANDVSLAQVVAGSASGVQIDALGEVNLGPITGPESGSGATSVGWVDVRGSAIVTHGIVTSGHSEGTGDGVRLVVNDSGRVDIRGPILARGGAVLIGLAEPTQDISSNASVNLSHNIYTADQTVTINGDVTLFMGISRLDLGVQPGPATDLFNRFEGSFELAGDPDLGINGVDPFSSQNQPRTMGHDPAQLHGCTPGNPCGVVSEPLADGRFLVSDIDPSANSMFVFAGDGDFYLVDAVGQFVLGRNDQSEGANGGAGCSSAWICGYSYGENQASANSLAQARVSRLRELFGFLTATIDTTHDGSTGQGANVTINGDVRRFVPEGYDANLSVDEARRVYPSFVNHELALLLGDSGSFVVAGALGDSLQQAAHTGSYHVDSQTGEPAVDVSRQLVDLDRPQESMPRLGLFQLRVTGGDGSNVDIRGGAEATYLNDYILNGNSAGGAPQNVLDAPRTYALRVTWTDKGPGQPTSPGDVPDLVFSDPSPIGNLPGTTPGGSGPGGDTGQSGFGSDGVNDIDLQVAGPIGAPNESTAEDDQRREDGETDGQGGGAVSEEDQCRQGAAQTADLGQSPGVSGAEPNVFARCRTDF